MVLLSELSHHASPSASEAANESSRDRIPSSRRAAVSWRGPPQNGCGRVVDRSPLAVGQLPPTGTEGRVSFARSSKRSSRGVRELTGSIPLSDRVRRPASSMRHLDGGRGLRSRALLPETMRRASKAHGARSRRQRRSGMATPEASHLHLLPGTVTRVTEERHGQADLRGECVP